MVQTTFSQKKKKIKIEKLKNQVFCHIRACVRVKDKNLCIFPDIDAIKYQMKPF